MTSQKKTPLGSVGKAVGAMYSALTTRKACDAKKCVEIVAVALEKSGETYAAADLRAVLASTVDRGPIIRTIGEQTSNLAEWMDPPTEVLEVDGALGAALDRLKLELAEVSKLVAAGVDAPARVLFSGPSGCGKTLAARHVAAELGLPLAVVRIERVVGGYLGETSAKLARLFESLTSCPAVLFLDEIDAFTCQRGLASDGPSREIARATSTMLQQLDALPPDQIVIAATNHPEILDGALLRRLPTVLQFGHPTATARRAMVTRWWARVEHTHAAVDEIVRLTEGQSGAQLRAVAMAAARAAVIRGELLHVDQVTAALEA